MSSKCSVLGWCELRNPVIAIPRLAWGDTPSCSTVVWEIWFSDLWVTLAVMGWSLGTGCRDWMVLNVSSNLDYPVILCWQTGIRMRWNKYFTACDLTRVSYPDQSPYLKGWDSEAFIAGSPHGFITDLTVVNTFQIKAQLLPANVKLSF